MFRRVAVVRTDVYEEHITSIIKVTRIGEPVTTLTVTSIATRRNIPEYGILHNHRSENLNSYKRNVCLFLILLK
jgi:hypothetical protein